MLSPDRPWLRLPYRELGLPSGESCRRGLEEWSASGAFAEAVRLLQRQLRQADRLDWSRVILDASRVEAQKGGEKVARTLRGTPACRCQLLGDGGGMPLALRLAAGTENEQRHFLPLLEALERAERRPQDLGADRGHASRAHEQALAQRQIRARSSQPRKRGQPIPAGQPRQEV